MHKSQNIQTFLGDLWNDFDRMFGDVQISGALREVEKELILLGAYAARGDTEQVSFHGRKAIELGASSEAILEIILTATLSRGPRALEAANEIISDLSLSKQPDKDLLLKESTIDFFISEYGELPLWAEHLHNLLPEYLSSYGRLRKQIQQSGIVSSKVKELLTMLLNTFDGSREGTAIHAKNAVREGATWGEVQDALLLGVLVGGIVVWIIGIGAIGEHL